jgi:uncharacterized membrane protein
VDVEFVGLQLIMAQAGRPLWSRYLSNWISWIIISASISKGSLSLKSQRCFFVCFCFGKFYR